MLDKNKVVVKLLLSRHMIKDLEPYIANAGMITPAAWIEGLIKEWLKQQKNGFVDGDE